MKLPNPERLLVEPEKIAGYLLNERHRHGTSKAKFFGCFGFNAERWQDLSNALIKHGRTHPVSKMKETGFGPRYEVEGRLPAPDGRAPLVRTVWQMDHGAVAPRLITAYPLDDNEDQ